MKERTPMEFKAATVDDAIANGLKELGLTIDQVEIEKKSYGGIFTKACVIITPKALPQAAPAEVKPAPAPVAEETDDADDYAPKAEASAAAPEGLAEATEACTEFVRGLIAKMGVDCDVISDNENNEVNIYVNGENAGQIIGYRGEVLDAIQYFALILANKGEKGFIRVQLDAGNYRRKRKETLANLARRLAEKAVRTGSRTILEPMNPFERRVIHTTLADDKEVTTQSEGEGKYRHVVIIPNNENTRNSSPYGRNDFRRSGPGRTRSFGGYNGGGYKKY